MMNSAMRPSLLSLSRLSFASSAFLSVLFLFSAAPSASAQAAAAAPAAFHPTRFSVAVGGSGPDVIMIPGLGGSRDVWKAEIAALTPHYRLHLVQIYGFAGYKPGPNSSGPLFQPITDELAQYIESNHLQQPAVVGHSMGGLIGLMLASQHPADVGKLLVIDALPFLGLLDDPKATVDGMKPAAVSMRTEMSDETSSTFLLNENAQIAGLVTDPEKRKLVTFWTVNSDRKVLGNAIYDDMTTDVRPVLSKITAPVTVLYAWDSSSGSQKDADKKWAAAYAGTPHLKLIRVDKSLHFIMFDQPQKFDQLLEEFLKS